MYLKKDLCSDIDTDVWSEEYLATPNGAEGKKS